MLQPSGPMRSQCQPLVMGLDQSGLSVKLDVVAVVIYKGCPEVKIINLYNCFLFLSLFPFLTTNISSKERKVNKRFPGKCFWTLSKSQDEVFYNTQ